MTGFHPLWKIPDFMLVSYVRILILTLELNFDIFLSKLPKYRSEDYMENCNPLQGCNCNCGCGSRAKPNTHSKRGHRKWRGRSWRYMWKSKLQAFAVFITFSNIYKNTIRSTIFDFLL